MHGIVSEMDFFHVRLSVCRFVSKKDERLFLHRLLRNDKVYIKKE